MEGGGMGVDGWRCWGLRSHNLLLLSLLINNRILLFSCQYSAMTEGEKEYIRNNLIASFDEPVNQVQYGRIRLYM